MSTNLQKINKRTDKQVRVDNQVHRALKLEAAKREVSLKRLLADICKEVLGENFDNIINYDE